MIQSEFDTQQQVPRHTTVSQRYQTNNERPEQLDQDEWPFLDHFRHATNFLEDIKTMALYDIRCDDCQQRLQSKNQVFT